MRKKLSRHSHQFDIHLLTLRSVSWNTLKQNGDVVAGRTDDELQSLAQAALGTTGLTPLVDGGQKKVYTAQLEGVPVVVKLVIIPPEHAAEVLERARREVELLAAVNSPHVVRVLSAAVELGDSPDAVCWVEELLDGQDLRNLSNTYPWPPERVWSLIRDVATGLWACHELEVVHRDLSPGNIRCCDDGRFVVMDPGLARHLTKTALTGAFQPGTPNYMTPEHIPGGRPTTASDVFALGLLAYQALTGEVAITAKGDMDAYYAELRTGQVQPVRTVDPDIPAELAAIVDRCLQRQPARRYLDAGELLLDLPAAGQAGPPIGRQS
jgi:serine/threonine-protein kinase